MNNNPKESPRLFHFKKFSLSDSQCGMKIGTDGVLLGSIAATYASRNTLDVGTGCGLIALMVAQKNEAQITALDIDPAAISQAAENVESSPWADRIRLVQSSLQEYSQQSPDRFDLIVCNPPFFHNSLRSKCSQRNTARHSSTLPPAQLIAGAENLLSEAGILLLIIPADQHDLFEEQVAACRLYTTRKLWIVPAPGKLPKRVVLEIARKQEAIRDNTLVIEMNGRHGYSDEYKKLTEDYYLNL